MEAHDLQASRRALSRRKLKGTAAFASTPFAKLASFNRGGVFVGRFTGHTPWERHRHGDELVPDPRRAGRSHGPRHAPPGSRHAARRRHVRRAAWTLASAVRAEHRHPAFGHPDPHRGVVRGRSATRPAPEAKRVSVAILSYTSAPARWRPCTRSTPSSTASVAPRPAISSTARPGTIR